MKKSELVEKLSEFVIELEMIEKSNRTIKKYRANIKTFLKDVPEDRELSKLDILNFKKSLMETNYKPSTINNYITAINLFMKYCDYGDDMKIKHIKVQKKYSLESIMSASDFKRLLRIAKRENDHEIYMIMKILGNTGIRIAELNFFTVESITGSFYIPVRNKGKDRNIIVPQDLARELRKYCRDNRIKSGKIFTLDQSTIWRRMKKIAGKARVNKSNVHAHAFRHHFSREFIVNGGAALELADIAGHSDLNTTRIYTQSTDEEKRHRIEQIQKNRR